MSEKVMHLGIIVVLLRLHSHRKLCHLVVEGGLASFNFLVELVEVVGSSVGEGS